MSQAKVIVLVQGGSEKRIALTSERMVIGRDEGCDIVIPMNDVSRKHAAILNKFGAIYVENISSTGRITKNGQEVEYVQVEEGEKIGIGEAVLFWEPLDEQKLAEGLGDVAEQDAAPANEALVVAADAGADAAVELAMPDAGDKAFVLEADDAAPRPEADHADFEILAPNEKTALAPSMVHPILKIIKGESTIREVKLDFGSAWIVGRGAQSHVFIDNHKLSRQHFKIVKVSDAFRVQDMGSANGTRLNGVAIKDAPLQTFDTIQAGPVEVQFILVDSQKFVPEMRLLDAPLLSNQSASAGSNENTQFLPPEVIAQHARASLGTENPFANLGSQVRDRPGMAAGSFNTSESRGGIGAWLAAQPRGRKIMYGSLAVLALVFAGLLAMPANNPAGGLDLAAKNPSSDRSPASAKLAEVNAADPREVSPEFALLSAEKQNEIINLYAKAERARSARDWKTAYDSSKAILNVVKRYKKATDILDESQSYLNEEQIGMLSKSLSTLEEATQDNKERLKLLLENGDKALAESRWDDAKESFSKALNLDPTNDRATQGFAAAHAHNSGVTVANIPKALPQVNPDAAEIERERDEIEGLKRRYQDARTRFNNGAYREALPIFKDLDSQLAKRMEEYNTGERAPASVRRNLLGETRSLRSRVREGIESSKSQLRVDYQSQLADAEQFIANRQYIEARDSFDRILRLEPDFDDVIEAREKLYTKIIVEAKTLYHEALIYESVSDLDNAVEGFKKTRDLLANVKNPFGIDYYKKALFKLKRLQR